MASVFTKIVAGEIPSWKVAENEEFYAFLDIFPLKKGHTLVIPKKEVDYIFDLDNQSFSDLMLFAKKVACAIKEVVPCKKIALSVVGLEVPHAHIHLIPIDEPGDSDFSNPKLKFTSEEYATLAEEISKAFQTLHS